MGEVMHLLHSLQGWKFQVSKQAGRTQHGLKVRSWKARSQNSPIKLIPIFTFLIAKLLAQVPRMIRKERIHSLYTLEGHSKSMGHLIFHSRSSQTRAGNLLRHQNQQQLACQYKELMKEELHFLNS